MPRAAKAIKPNAALTTNFAWGLQTDLRALCLFSVALRIVR
jgi:hypothetical protein